MNAEEQNKKREDLEKKDQLYEKYNNRFDNRPLILRILTKKFWSRYFDLTTNEFGRRILKALVPCTGNFFSHIHGNPDLYGPFWIYNTLIFCLAAAGNMSRYIRLPIDLYFKYDFSFLPNAFFFVYLYGILAPLIVNYTMKLFDIDKPLLEAICIYGYSTIIFIPISFFCIIDSSVVQWLFMLLGSVHSTYFLLYNYWIDLKSIKNNNKYVILFVMIIAQLALFLTFILYFFKDIYDERTKRDIYNSINRRNNIQLSNGEEIYNKIIHNYITQEI